jgi:hypothetical protein
MIADTPVPVITAFLPTLLDHDKLAAASVLRTVPTLLLIGDADLVTPLEHSRVLAAELPQAELVIEQGAGHAVVLERPDAVNEWIRALVARAAAGPGVPRPRVPADEAKQLTGRGGRLRALRRRRRGRRLAVGQDAVGEQRGAPPVQRGVPGQGGAAGRRAVGEHGGTAEQAG